MNMPGATVVPLWFLVQVGSDHIYSKMERRWKLGGYATITKCSGTPAMASCVSLLDGVVLRRLQI